MVSDHVQHETMYDVKMFQFLVLTIFSLIASSTQQLPSLDQIVIFKNNTNGHIKKLTTNTGAPVEKSDVDSTLNMNLLTNEYFIETVAHLNRERIPSRPVHLKGTGAFGYFETTHNFSHICKAELFSEVGKKTPVAVRFSMGVTENGGSDLNREAKGLAVKFYTKEGNWDVAGFNTPVFIAKDPFLFSPFAHAVNRNPATGLKDPNMIWDFFTLHPETFYIFMVINGYPGITDGYRHMSGHLIHTYQVYNNKGVPSFCRFHFYPQAGTKYLNSSTAAQLGARDPDYSSRDLYDAIAKGDFPSWKLSAQCLSEKEVKNAKFDVFDISLRIPESMCPLQEVGILYLNKNPKNMFADIEQLAISPGNLVPGIQGGPDKAFEARRFAYRDSHRYRLGANFDKITVNCPYRSEVNTYNRDGIPSVSDNGKDAPNYYPNSFNGPKPYKDPKRPPLRKIHEKEANNIEQARDYYKKEMSSDEQNVYLENVLLTLCRATSFLQDKAVNIFRQIDPQLGDRVSSALVAKQCRH